VARERDLCDVKVKITEYFDGDELTEQTGQQPPGRTNTLSLDGAGTGAQFFGQNSGGAGSWGMPGMTMAQTAPASTQSKRFYTIQRVNGNGGNGKGDGVAGPHKHTLEESDRVKKNSVQRWLANNERERKKAQVRISLPFNPNPFQFRRRFCPVDCRGLAVPVLGGTVCYSSNRRMHGTRSYDYKPKQHVILILTASMAPRAHGDAGSCTALPRHFISTSNVFLLSTISIHNPHATFFHITLQVHSYLKKILHSIFVSC
jgi:hypothetical protein